MRWWSKWRARRWLEKQGDTDFVAADTLENLGDAYGYPHEWHVCQFCGKTTFQWPPHMQDPCPLVEAVSHSVGTKMDAERNIQIMASQHMQEALRRLEELGGGGES